MLSILFQCRHVQWSLEIKNHISPILLKSISSVNMIYILYYLITKTKQMPLCCSTFSSEQNKFANWIIHFFFIRSAWVALCLLDIGGSVTEWSVNWMIYFLTQGIFLRFIKKPGYICLLFFVDSLYISFGKMKYNR